MFNSSLRYLYVFLLAVYSYLNIKFTEGDQLLGGSVPEIYLIVWIGVLVILIWEANRGLFGLRQYQRQDNMPKYLLFGFLLSIIHVLLLALGSASISFYLDIQSFTGALKLSLGFIFRVNLFLHCVNAIIFYQYHLRETQLAMEVAQKDTLQANYNALKRQVSPHFLFNSLNVLDELINQDTKKASEFLSRLSRVYRYIISNQSVDLVSLREEVEFIKAYIYLLEVRFQNHLEVNIDIPSTDIDKKILPAALQLLIENTIKHNEVSASNKLIVNVSSDSEYLTVENSIQQKVSSSNSSNGVGLQNIMKRYRFFIDKEVTVTNDGQSFRVKLPLLTSE